MRHGSHKTKRKNMCIMISMKKGSTRMNLFSFIIPYVIEHYFTGRILLSHYYIKSAINHTFVRANNEW